MPNDPLSSLGVPAQPASAAPSNPSSAQPVSSALSTPSSAADPLASLGPVAQSAANPPSLGSRVLAGAAQAVAPIAAIVNAPETPTEQVIHALSGDPGLSAYRVAKGLVSSAENVVKSGAAEYPNAVRDYQKTIQDFHNHDWRNAASSVGSLASDVAGIAQPISAGGMQDVRQLTEGERPGGNLATPLTRQAIVAGAALAGGAVVGAEAPEIAEGAGEGDALSRLRVNPFRTKIARQITQGESFAQPAAKASLGEAANSAAADSGVPGGTGSGGVRTSLDDPIAQVSTRERALYDKLNAAAGTDMKDLYDRQEQLQDAFDDPNNIAQRRQLQVELERTKMQVANAENTAKDSMGVNARKLLQQAKADTQQRYALQEVKAKMFNNESVVSGNTAAGAPETININGAIKAAEKLNKPSRWAPEGTPTRLQQALGEDGANSLLKNLYEAQKEGKIALTRQQWAGRIAKTVAGGGIGYEVIKGIFGG